MRIGMGYDIHRLVSGRKLILGGIHIPFEKGLLGHSDADVLVHAVCDALLGAAGLDDIGTHFPDTDPEFKNIYSIKLLENTAALVRTRGFEIINADVTLFAEKPKLAPYRSAIKETLSKTLEIEPHRINIKATTAEGLGPVGRGDGIAAMCVALLSELSG